MYPLTIFKARYCGVYEGGKWVAMNLKPGEIHPDAMGSDTECNSFFRDNEDKVGIGETMEEAVADLKKKMEKMR
jgi:hypothetical protein